MTDLPAPVPRALRVAALVKQIPAFEEMRLGPDGRLDRAGRALEMSAYDRRAVAQGVALARASGGSCTVITLGPPSAEDVLREAVAFGADDGVLVTDPAFAGSDTLATARALSATIRLLEGRHGSFDLLLVGRNSVDAETGQVGPQVAELLDLPFAAGVKRLDLGTDATGRLHAAVGLEHDDTWVEATVALPAVLSTAERLIDPCKIKDPAVWATVDAGRLTTVTAAELGAGPWGSAASPTWVGETRLEVAERAGLVLTGTVETQVAEAVRLLADRGALQGAGEGGESADEVPPPGPADGPVVVVVVEPDRHRLTRELLSGAARLAARIGAQVVALGLVGAMGDDEVLAAWGADRIVAVGPPLLCATDGLPPTLREEDVSAALVAWLHGGDPSATSVPVAWAVLVGGTVWGREVTARAAAALGAGLTGDAVGLAVEVDTRPRPDRVVGAPEPAGPRLLAWKPAFGGGLVAAIRSDSPVQMATVRAGVLPTMQPRVPPLVIARSLEIEPRSRVSVTSRRREDDFDRLLTADAVVGVGQGIEPGRYGELQPLLAVLGAELGATRKVTDNGWLPHARQIGITGHSIAPRLYLAIGTSGKFNHLAGVRAAGTVLAINPDPDAPVFAAADLGIVGPWDEVVPQLAAAVTLWHQEHDAPAAGADRPTKSA